MISITGAAGKTGRAVVQALAARGPGPGAAGAHAPAVRCLVHRRERMEVLASLGAAEVVVGDLTDAASLERALAGSRVVHHICPNMRRDEEEIGHRVIEVCRRLGVERLVYHSVLHPQIEAMPHHWKKLRVEERLIESGLAFTILQPAAYMQNLRDPWESAKVDGVFRVPYAATTRIGMVDLADVAEAAAEVLAGAGHAGAIYELCGPEVLDQHEIAVVMAGRPGREVRVEVTPREEWAAQARRAGLSDYAVDSLIAMFRHYEAHGFGGSQRVLEWLLGRQATRFDQVVERWASSPASGNKYPVTD